MLFSIGLIKERIARIKEILLDREVIFEKLSEKYYYEAVKINLIEIGEESKIINDILLVDQGNWDEVLSKEYSFRISLTHYYKNMANKKIDKHIERDFDKFVEKIDELEEKYKNK